MILLDMNVVLTANLITFLKTEKFEEVTEDLVRHIILNSIRGYSKQFKSEYGSMVICLDSKDCWRKSIFPYYKARRQKSREVSPIDWSQVFVFFNKIKTEIKENFPYKVISVEAAEADDIIAALTKKFHKQEKILVLSTDKDFIQLQKYPGVSQYSPIKKTYIKSQNPKMDLKEHIIRGDSGDGIPNFMSPDDCFITKTRQKSVMTKKLVSWLDEDPENFCQDSEQLRGYHRNAMLIDFEFIPSWLTENIIQEYESYTPKSRKQMLDYFIQKRMRNLMESASDF